MGDENLADQEEDELDKIDQTVDGSAEDEDHVVDEWEGDEGWGEEEDDEDALIVPDVPSYIDNENGTISDSRHSVMWAKSDSFEEFKYGINWYEAHDYCESLNEKKFAGFDDWRLPGFDEAKTLFSFDKSNYDKDDAEIHIDPMFESNGGHNTWTYEEKPDYHQYAMKFSYITGNEMWENKDNEYSHVRAVRDEIKDDWEPEWRKDSKKFDG
jgi:hypothetical protein